MAFDGLSAAFNSAIWEGVLTDRFRRLRLAKAKECMLTTHRQACRISKQHLVKETSWHNCVWWI